jgi:hypothetical protein
MTCVLMVIGGGAGRGAGVRAAGIGVRGAVMLPTIRAVAKAAREMVVPAIIMGVPPGARVWMPGT